jgi:lipoate-protein ligase B
MQDAKEKRWLWIDLPLVEYKEGWDLQANLVTARKTRAIDKNIILLLEHPPVFTLGRRGGFTNLKVTEAFLKTHDISVIKVERGGHITFHGPGQIVMYPIIDLRLAGMSVSRFIENLEEVMIRVVSDSSIRAERNPLNRGIWVGHKKMGSVGIDIRHGITFHGMALNVNISLEPFSWINPCGLKGVEITSMEQELSHKVSMDQVRKSMKRYTMAVFGIEPEETDLKSLTNCISKNSKAVNENACSKA